MNGIKWGFVEKPVNKLHNVIIVASGPSVNDINLAMLKTIPNTYIIAVNGAGQHVPFANAWFTLDPWGLDGPQLPTGFSGKLYAAVPDDFGTANARAIKHRVTAKKNITFLHRLQSHNFTNTSSDTAYKLGLSEDSSCISTGNSGYGALNLAYHLRPSNIYILGVDGNIGYFYTKTEKNRPLTYLPSLFASSATQLADAGIAVTNVSPLSTVKCFPRISASKFHSSILV